MATNFPASLDTLTNPTSSDSLSSPSHSAQHANVNDAIEALQAKVGADSSAVTTSHDYKIAQLEAGATGGKILQVVTAFSTSTFTTTSGSYVDSGFSATITPSSTSSKILSILTIRVDGPSADATYGRLYRGTVAAGTSLEGTVATRMEQYGISSREVSTHTAHFVDSPSTTSAQQYSLGVLVGGGASTTWGSATGTVWTLLEIAG